MPSIALDKIEKRGFERGVAQGISQGISQGMEEVAMAMIDEGEPVEKIQRITKLSFEYIRQLAENLKNKIKS